MRSLRGRSRVSRRINKTKAKVMVMKASALELIVDAQVYIHAYIGTWSLQDLTLEHRAAFEQMKATGVGVRFWCRWTAGCRRCDEAKA